MKGTIERVVLNDFMCYGFIEFWPGRFVNLVVAPNGCGKSSFIAGIMLGLGGRVQDVARGKNLGTYVRAGRSVGRIEIQLNNGSEESIVISRYIQADNKSWFTLDGSRVGYKQIDEVVRKLNIQIDNLCQVLPQDRVYEFSCLNSHTLLENTERSVGPCDLVVYHEKLKGLSKEKLEIDEKFEKASQKIRSLVEENDIMSGKIQRHQRKHKILAQIESLKKDFAWKVYQSKYTVLKKLRTDEASAKQVVKTLRAERLQELEKIEDLKHQLNSFAPRVDQKMVEMRSLDLQINALINESDKEQDAIDLANEDYEELLQVEKRRQDQLAELRLHLNKLETDLMGISQYSEEEQQQRIEDLNAELKDEFNLLSTANQEETGVQIEILNITHKIRAKENTLRELEDVSKVRLQKLQYSYPDVYQALMWLRNNREQFQSIVYEPIMLEMNVLNPSYSTFIEAAVPGRDLMAFVCEDITDMNRFVETMREQLKLRINAVYSGPEHPSSSSFQPPMPIEELREFGFNLFVRDMFTTPEPVMKYLCRTFNIHSIPVGSEEVDVTFDRVPLSLFYSQKSKYSTRMSRYTGTRVASVNPLFPGNLLTIDNRRFVEETQASIRQLEREREALQPKLEDAQGRVHAIDKRMQRLRAERRELESTAESKQILKSRIESRKERICSVENSKIDFDAEDRRYAQKLLCHTTKIVQIHEQIAELVDLCGKICIDVHQLHSKEQTARAALLQAKLDAETILSRCSEQERILEHIQQQLPGAREKAEILLKKAMELTGKMPPVEFFQKGTPEDIAQKIQEYQAQADFIGDGDANMFQLYEEQKKQIEELKERFTELENGRKKKRRAIEEVQKLWLPLLEDIVEKINANYTRYFMELGCCGEVKLFKPKDRTAYDQYGIKISVKFRDADPLTELNQHTQSGGERSVATALYILALQQLTCVPFRIVDEINQGMDIVNERKVYEMMVGVTQVQNAAQYFLLSPKLLPELSYPANMTVITIYANNWTKRQLWTPKDAASEKLKNKHQAEATEID